VENYVKAVVSLFKAVPIFEHAPADTFVLDNESNVAHGFFITDEAFKACPLVANQNVIDLIEKKFGYNVFELNQGFYKSFKTVAESTPEKILANKLLHYMSTYGFESMGIFSRDTVFVPNDALELPQNAPRVKITLINALNKDEIKYRVEKMIASGIALADETLENLLTIIKYLNMKFDVDELPNKELRVRLYKIMDTLPKNPAEFLRYLIYLVDDTTLLIKSPEKIQRVRLNNNSVDYDKLFAAYINQNGIEKLAEIFHRYKPLWLAFKPYSKFMASTINKMRKLADTYHKPLAPKLLETVTSNSKINVDELKRELEKVTVFKRISLANAILFRTDAPESIAYMIRNGKIFVSDYDKKFKFNYATLTTIINSIVETVRPNVKGKKIFLPDTIDYAAPVSEKKFIGGIPFGSSYTFDSKSVVVGVHWFNLGDERVDLDLHMNSIKRDIGWHNDFNDENFIDTKTERVIFSGDMTDAPADSGGATEAFFVGESLKDEMIMVNLNRYTYHKDAVPFKLVLGNVNEGKIDRKYLIGAHEISFCVPNKIDGGEMFIGFLDSDADGNKKFYFSTAATGSRIVARSDENSARMTAALRTSFESCLKLKTILQDAGAIFEKSSDEDWDINLDPQVVTKDTFLDLFKS